VSGIRVAPVASAVLMTVFAVLTTIRLLRADAVP
jgi:hypothetical protein